MGKRRLEGSMVGKGEKEGKGSPIRGSGQTQKTLLRRFLSKRFSLVFS
jgi:hypothetical protein